MAFGPHGAAVGGSVDRQTAVRNVTAVVHRDFIDETDAEVRVAGEAADRADQAFAHQAVVVQEAVAVHVDAVTIRRWHRWHLPAVDQVDEVCGGVVDGVDERLPLHVLIARDVEREIDVGFGEPELEGVDVDVDRDVVGRCRHDGRVRAVEGDRGDGRVRIVVVGDVVAVPVGRAADAARARVRDRPHGDGAIGEHAGSRVHHHDAGVGGATLGDTAGGDLLDLGVRPRHRDAAVHVPKAVARDEAGLVAVGAVVAANDVGQQPRVLPRRHGIAVHVLADAPRARAAVARALVAHGGAVRIGGGIQEALDRGFAVARTAIRRLRTGAEALVGHVGIAIVAVTAGAAALAESVVVEIHAAAGSGAGRSGALVLGKLCAATQGRHDKNNPHQPTRHTHPVATE